MNHDNQNDEQIKELKENSAEISAEDLEGVTGGSKYVPIPDPTCKACKHMQCVLCGKQCNGAYYINHACLHNELVPNTCEICRFRKTMGGWVDGKARLNICEYEG